MRKINHGIACRIGNTIYYNKKLEGYPDLLGAILKHEKNHTDTFTVRDVMLDLEIKELKGFKKRYYDFIINNPSSLTELLPCFVYDKKLIFNPLISAMWVIVGGAIWLITHLSNPL